MGVLAPFTTRLAVWRLGLDTGTYNLPAAQPAGRVCSAHRSNRDTHVASHPSHHA